MKNQKSMIELIREVKNQLHDEWIKDPIASKRAIMGSVEHLNQKYGSKALVA